jgi:hypothetical protein
MEAQAFTSGCPAVQCGAMPKASNRLWQRVLTRSALAMALLVVAPYLWAPIYKFPQAERFFGSQLWNPYAGISGGWQRANLHAHGRAWGGLTNGRQSDDEVAQGYRDLGYDVPGVSDYQRIAAHHGVSTLPLYEHGFNLGKSHQIAIGARSVEWFDFLFFQGLSHQQYVIDRVKRTSDLVALAHPGTRNAYGGDALEHLTGYDLIEVINGPFVTESVWDTALSSGRPVWAVANDDTHDLEDVRRRAAAWTMIASATADTADIVRALKAGRSYAVLRTGAIGAAHVTVVDRVDLRDTTLSVSVSGAPSTFTFVGHGGVVRKTVHDATAAHYTLTDADTYVRTVIASPQTRLYLNPIVRYDGALPLAAPVATVDVATTWLLRGSTGLGCSLLALAYARRRRVVSRPATRPSLVGANRNTA